MTTKKATKVYVVMTGCYENTWYGGVYSSAKAAMKAHPVKREGKRGNPYAGSAERPGGWRKEDGYWDNGLDWDEAASIYECTLDE